MPLLSAMSTGSLNILSACSRLNSTANTSLPDWILGYSIHRERILIFRRMDCGPDFVSSCMGINLIIIANMQV